MNQLQSGLLPSSRLLRIILIGLTLIVVLLPLHGLLSTWGGMAIGPLVLWKSWKEILLVGLLVLALIWLLRHRAEAKLFFSDKLVLVILLYAGLTIIDGLAHLTENGATATAAGLVMNLRFGLIFLLCYGLFRFASVNHGLWRRYIIQFLLAVGAVLAVLGLIQVTMSPNDFLTNFGYEKGVTIAPYTLIDDNPDAPRAFATLRGPNDYAAYLILPLIISLLFAYRHRGFVVLSLIIGAAMVASSSRSAWIGALVAVMSLLILMAGRSFWRSKLAWSGMLAGFVVAVGLVFAALSVPAIQLAIFHSSPDDPSLVEGSTESHWQATGAGIGRIIDSPLGCGPGCAGPASYYGDSPYISENYYVQVGEETGIIGLGLFLLILGVVCRRLYRLRHDWLATALLASLIGLSAVAVWLHTWSDDPLALTVWALIGAILGMASSHQSGKKPADNVL